MKTNQIRNNRIGILFSLTALSFLPVSSNAQLNLDINGNVGIGTATPARQLDVYGTNPQIRAKISSGTSSYAISYLENNSSSVNLCNLMGGSAMSDTLFGVSRAGAGQIYTNNAPLVIGTGQYHNLTLGAYNLQAITILASNRFVGIGTKTPVCKLEVNGQIRTTNDTPEKPTIGSWAGYSDQRLKKDIAPFKDGIAVLRQVHPITYKFNGIGNLSPNETHIGVIAQDIKPVAPYCVSTGKLIVKQSESANFSAEEIITLPTDSSGVASLPADASGEAQTIVSPLMYNYDGLIYVMINSIKQLDSTNSAKDEKLQTMQNQINQLESIVNSCCNMPANKSMQPNNSNSQLPINSFDVVNGNNNNTSAILYQNIPNPFNQQTSIQYFIPAKAQNASIMVFDLNGKLMSTVPVTSFGKGAITINGKELNPGMFVYSLVVDGKIIDTKRMILTQ